MFHKSCRMCKHVAYAGGDLGLLKEYYCDAIKPNMPLYGYPVLPFACPENKCEPRKPNRFEQFREQTATIDGLVNWSLKHGRCTDCHYFTNCDDEVIDEHKCKAGIKAYWESEVE